MGDQGVAGHEGGNPLLTEFKRFDPGRRGGDEFGGGGREIGRIRLERQANQAGPRFYQTFPAPGVYVVPLTVVAWMTVHWMIPE